MQSVPEHQRATVAGRPASAGVRRWHRPVTGCCWGYLLMVLAAWAVLYAGDLWWPATLLLFGPRWLLALPALPLLGLAVYRRQRSPTVAVLLALVLVLGPIMGFQIPWRTALSAAPPGKRLRVLTCNMHHQKPRPDALKLLLAEAQPDIVAVQELSSREPFDYFPTEDWHVHRTYGRFLASRHPIRSAESLGHNSMTVPGLIGRYEVETPAGRITLFSVHLASPRDGLHEAIHHPATESYQLEANSVLRRQQLESLAQLAGEAAGPVVLMGDFNTPSESPLFRRTWGGYTDAFTTAGWGWGYTFLGSRTTVRIDHILAGPGWYCERCWVGPNVGSPHRPVLADLIRTQPDHPAP